MVAALRADVEVLLDFLAVDDLLAIVALDPQTFRDGDLFFSRFLRLLLFAEPGHRSDLSKNVRAQRVEALLELARIEITKCRRDRREERAAVLRRVTEANHFARIRNAD